MKMIMKHLVSICAVVIVIFSTVLVPVNLEYGTYNISNNTWSVIESSFSLRPVWYVGTHSPSKNNLPNVSINLEVYFMCLSSGAFVIYALKDKKSN